MPRPKPLTREMIVNAMAHTKSARSCANYLNVSYPHFKRWAQLYKDEKTGKSLFEVCKNPSGKGIPKFLKSRGNEPDLLDIIEGRKNGYSFSAEKIKRRLIQEGYLEEKCAYCNFRERRVLDYKMPLLLNFKNGIKTDWRLENLELLCYNHYFLFVGDIFNEKQIAAIENFTPKGSKTSDNWKLDKDQLAKLKEIGLPEGISEEDLNKYIEDL